MALVITTSQPAPGCWVWQYNNIDTADSAPSQITPGGTQPALGFIQAVGTFGGATVKLQGSNDGSNWVDLEDPQGDAIGLTAAGGAEFSTSAAYIRPLVTSGTGDDLDVFISLRG